MCVWGGGLKPVLRSNNPRSRFMNIQVIRCAREGLLTHQCTKTVTYESRFNTVMKQDKDSTALEFLAVESLKFVQKRIMEALLWTR